MKSDMYFSHTMCASLWRYNDSSQHGIIGSTCVANTRTWQRGRCTTWGFTLRPTYSLCVVWVVCFFAKKTVVWEWEQSDYARETNYLWQTMWIYHHRGQESGAERRETGKWKKTEEKGESERRSRSGQEDRGDRGLLVAGLFPLRLQIRRIWGEKKEKFHFLTRYWDMDLVSHAGPGGSCSSCSAKTP